MNRNCLRTDEGVVPLGAFVRRLAFTLRRCEATTPCQSGGAWDLSYRRRSSAVSLPWLWNDQGTVTDLSWSHLHSCFSGSRPTLSIYTPCLVSVALHFDSPRASAKGWVCKRQCSLGAKGHVTCGWSLHRAPLRPH